MSQQIIIVGAQPNDGQGDPIRNAFIKTNNNFTELFVRFQTTPPVTLVGKSGDVPGMYASDASYFYYCFATYNATSEIWNRVSNGNVTVIPNQLLNGNSSVNIPTSGGNVQITVGSAGQVGNFYSGGLSLVGALSANTVLANTLTVSQYTVQNLNVPGNIVGNSILSNGNVQGSYVLGNGAYLTGLVSSYSNSNVAAYLPTNSSNVGANAVIATGNITTSSNLVALGNVYGSNLSLTGRVVAAGNIVAPYVFGNFVGTFVPPGSNGQVLFNSNGTIGATPSLTVGNSNLSFSGNVIGNKFIGDGSGLSNLQYSSISGIGNVSSLNLSGNSSTVLSGNGAWMPGGTGTVTSVLGNGGSLGFALSGNVTTSGNLTLTGPNVTDLRATLNIGNVANLLLPGDTSLFLSGDGTWSPVSGNGGNAVNYSNANVAAYLASNSNTQIVTSGNISGGYILGNGALLTGLSTNTYGNSNVSDYLAGGNNTGGFVTTGNIGATYFIGNGALLSGIASYSNTNVSTYLASNSNSQIVTTGNITGGYLIGNGALITGLSSYSNTNVSAYLSSNSNLQINSTSNITTTANISGGYIFGNGAFLTGISSGNSNVSPYGNSNVISLLGSGSNLPINTSANVTANHFIGNGALLTGIVANSTYGNSNVSDYLNSGSANTDIVTSGSIYGDYLYGNGYYITGIPINEYGNYDVENLLASGEVYTDINTTANISCDYIFGNGAFITGLAESSYGNSNVGEYLSSGSADFDIITTANIGATYFIGNGALLSGLSSYSNTNTESYLSSNSNVQIITSGNISGGNISGSYILGNGALLTGLPESYSNTNVSAYLSNGNNVDGFSTSGNVDARYFNGTFVGNITGNFVVPGANTEIIYNENGNAAASANLTFDQRNLCVIGNVQSSGNLTGAYIIGNGSLLTGITVEYGNTEVAEFLASGNNSSDIITTGNIGAGYFIGNGSLLTGVSNYGNANVANYLGSGSNTVISVTGNIKTSGYLLGNGSLLTGVSNYSNTNVSAYLNSGSPSSISITGNIRAGNSVRANYFIGSNVSVTGNITGAYLKGNGSLLTGLATYSNAETQAYLSSGNVTSINTGFLRVRNDIYTDGDVTVVGNILTQNEIYGYSLSAYSNVIANNVNVGNAVVANVVRANYFVGGNLTINSANYVTNAFQPYIKDLELDRLVTGYNAFVGFANYTGAYHPFGFRATTSSNILISTDKTMTVITSLDSSASLIGSVGPAVTTLDGWRHTLKLRDNGNPQALVWGPEFTPIAVTLPLSTEANRWLYVGMMYNNVTTTWDVLSVGQQQVG